MNAVLKICLCAFGLAASTLVNAEQLGRLFFTAEQRTQLESNKVQNADSGNNSRALTINGIVQKHGGARTVWINGVPQVAGKSDDRAPEIIPVAIPGQVQPVKIKVGQRVLLVPPASDPPVSPGQ
jgi:hypothetical protein